MIDLSHAYCNYLDQNMSLVGVQAPTTAPTEPRKKGDAESSAPTEPLKERDAESPALDGCHSDDSKLVCSLCQHGADATLVGGPPRSAKRSSDTGQESLTSPPPPR